MKYLKIGLPIVAAAIVLISFQNCGKGFQVAEGLETSFNSLDAGSSGVTGLTGPTGAAITGLPAKILILSPFAASGNRSLPYNSNYTSLLTNAGLHNVSATSSFLSNANFKIATDDAFPTQIASPKEDLNFTADNPKFLQVNTYFQLQTFIENLNAASAFPSNAKNVAVNAHCQQGANSFNNAFYSSSSSSLCLGNSTISGTTVYSGFDADVTVHEFGHSINHSTASDEILNSTTDMGALDEGFADVWAFLNNGSPHIGEWFGAAIIQNSTGIVVNPYDGLRNLTLVPNYPKTLVAEIHNDSTALSSIFYELSINGVAFTTLRQLNSRVLADLQVGDSFGSVARYLQEEGASLGISSALIINALTKRGLYRKDLMSQINADITSVNIVDNHQFAGFQNNGNCNGKLDAGETVVLVLNLSNVGAEVGLVSAKMKPVSKLVVEAGGDFGSYITIDANSTYLKTLSRFSSSLRQQQVLFSAFLVTAPAGSGGTSYPVDFVVTGFDSKDSTPTTKTIRINIPVGTVAGMTAKCPGTGETDVWVKYQ